MTTLRLTLSAEECQRRKKTNHSLKIVDFVFKSMKQFSKTSQLDMKNRWLAILYCFDEMKKPKHKSTKFNLQCETCI